MINDPDFLKKLAIEIDTYPNYGVMTCQILNENHVDGSEYKRFEFNLTLNIDRSPRWFLGAFLFFRPEVFRQLNGFDEDFFMYCEDEDICLRVQQLGLKLEKINSLSVYHIGGVSEPVKQYDFYFRWFRSKILFAHKHLTDAAFKQLLADLNRKAAQKQKMYSILKWFNAARYTNKCQKWTVMQDVVQKTLHDGTDWLYFKLNADSNT